jgi:hypothetical protein
LGRRDVIPKNLYWHAASLWRCGGRNPSPRVRSALLALGYTKQDLLDLRDFEQD